jgi:hypothetical protein
MTLQSINTHFIHGLNALANAADRLARAGGRVIVPTTLGAIGGWMAGVGAPGAFQGLTSSLVYTRILSPAGNYQSKYRNWPGPNSPARQRTSYMELEPFQN